MDVLKTSAVLILGATLLAPAEPARAQTGGGAGAATPSQQAAAKAVMQATVNAVCEQMILAFAEKASSELKFLDMAKLKESACRCTTENFLADGPLQEAMKLGPTQFGARLNSPEFKPYFVARMVGEAMACIGTQLNEQSRAVPIGAIDSVIKIGHVGPISGPLSHLGKDNENGARLAVEELNERGVVIGGRRMNIELVTADDAGDPRQGAYAAQKMVDAKVAGLIGHLTSGASIPASKIYRDAGIPQISPSATNPKYSRQGYRTAFRIAADDVQMGVRLGRYALEEMKGKAIAIIDDRTAYGGGLAEIFKKTVQDAGGQFVAHEFTHDRATDFTEILTTIKAKTPDVVFFGGMDAVAGPMLRQMKAFGINAKFMGGDGICSNELARLAGDALGDYKVLCAEAGGFEEHQTVGLETFKKKFKARFNADVQVYAPYTYDAVHVMVAAMVKAGSADPERYLQVLAKTDGFKGVTDTISFDERGDIRNGAFSLYSYWRGKREQIAVIR